MTEGNRQTEPGAAFLSLGMTLEEAEQTLEAIQNHRVDGFVVSTEGGEQVFTLAADQPYRVFVERMQQGAVTVDAGRLIVYSNSAFARLVGCPADQVTGSPLDRFLDGVVPARFFDQLVDAGEGGELFLRCCDGTRLLAHVAATRFESQDQPLTCLVFTDLTSSPGRAERAIRRQNAAARAIANNSSSCVFMLDGDCLITFINDAALRIAGFSR